MRVARAVRGAALAVAMALLSAVDSSGASLVATSTTAFGLESASRFNAHWVSQRYWVAFHNGTTAVLYSSPDAVAWTSQGAIFSSFNPPANQGDWVVRYDGARIIAVAFNTGNGTRYYRNGTLNADGSVSWNAADAVAQAGASSTPLNALVANQRPVYWRSTAAGNGQLARGTQLNGPAWANLPLPPALAAVTGGGFSAAGLFATGGPDPDDLILLRATTQAAYAAGNHRLVSVKFDSSLNAHDGAWYNVSTLNGGLPEGATTDVKPGTDGQAHQRFAAVRDTGGDLHAVYVNRNDDVVHYRKTVGFTDFWSRVSTDVTASAAVIDRVALSALGGGQLALFYSKSDAGIYYRLWSGAAWSGETTLQAASATPLQGAIVASELADGCSVGLAWTEKAASPFDVRFQAVPMPCGGMRVKSGSYTGSGLARSITGVGFQPDVVIIDGVNGGANSVIRTSTMANPNSKQIDTPTGLAGNQITSLDADGFSLGTDTDVNQNTITYHWVAFKAGAGAMRVGTYAGAAAAQDITGVGFSPDYVIVMSPNADEAMQRSALMPPGFCLNFAGAGYSDSILDTLPDGFRVGADSSVAGAGVTFHYVAWNAIPGQTALGRYPGNKADGRNITGAGFQPEYVIVDRSHDIGSPTGDATGNAPVHKTAASGVNTDSATLFNGNLAETDNIQELQADGFQVGTHCRVNGDGTCNVPVPVAYYWMAFGPHVPKINYRSIGVAANLAGPAGDGIVVSAGSTSVTKTGGAGWKTANRGRGDVLTVGANSYVIRSVDSENQLTLASPAVAGYSGAYTIARQFRGGGVSRTALVNWEDCVDGPPGTACPAVAPVASASLVADDRREIGIVYDDASPAILLTSTFQIQDSTTDATHGIRLTADGVNRHYGVAGAGVVLDANLGGNEFDIRDANVTVEWLEFVRARGDNIAAIQVWSTDGDLATNVVLQNLLIHDFGDKLAGSLNSSGIDLAGDNTLTGKSMIVRNTMIWDGDQYGIEGDGPLDAALIENVSIDGMKVRGIHTAQGPFVVRNSIVTSSLSEDYGLGGTGSLSGSNNTSSDGTAALYFGAPLTASAAASFVTPNANLHLLGGANSQVDSGLDLSASFSFDIDGQLRPAGAAWDRGADERGATTAVKLQSFAAIPGDASVRLEWRTGSELDNLGFHVYRGLSESGPWTRLTSSLIPGLGSSALGQAYSYLDSGLTNGTRYFYRLEDVDASSQATSYGPVSAVPTAGASGGDGRGDGGSGAEPKRSASRCPDWVWAAYGAASGSDAAGQRCTRHGDPEASSLSVLSRNSRSATLELRTGGFYAVHTLSGASEPSGTVRVFVPGFDFPQDEKAAALPIRRALSDAVVGRRVQLGGVRALELQSFQGLVPSAIGRAEMQVGRDGTVRAARRGARAAARSFPKSELVTLLPSLFQGETKRAVVEIAPLRFDAQRRQLVLARRVLVRLLFTGREIGESGRGSLGRAPGFRKPAVSGEILARLYTTTRGLHAVSFEQLFPGQRRGLGSTELRLERQGEPVGFHLEPATSGFGPGSRLFFYADTTAASTDFSAELALELVRARDGVPMPLASAAPGSNAVLTPAIASRSFETNRFYQPGLLDAQDPWLWEALVSGTTRVKALALSGVFAVGTAELDVFLQGASESGLPVDHHVSVSLNGTLVGEARFAGKIPYRISLSLPASLLHEGANDLSLTNVADTGVSSLVFLDRVTLAHPQTSALAGGRFEGTWPEGGTASVSGASGGVFVLDVTDASDPSAAARWLTGVESSGAAVRFHADAGRLYLAVSETALLTPRVAAPEPSTLRATTNQADYVLVAPKAFLSAAEPLVQRRQDRGLATRAVSFEEIASEFGHGRASAEAIRAFLAYAFHSWARPSPRYVLLLGDSSYDPRNFIGTSPPAPLPALWTKTSYLWTASDPQLAAVNGADSLPDLAIGRLPAATLEQAQALVAKLLDWEDSGQGLAGPAALVADNPDLAGDFEADVRDIAQSYLSERSPQLLLLSQLGAGTRPRIQDALNSGLSFLNYVGHGGAAVWASENVWNSWDAPSLLAQSQQPLLVTMNCLNGYFVAPSFDSLSESLLKAEGRGAIASFSPSGLSLDGPAHQYHRALMAALTSGQHDRLGDALLAAQKTYADTGLMPELLGVYHLFGDPAMTIR